jgi:hypothetical protein
MNSDYVLAPFNYFLSNCQNNVLLALRTIENTDEFPIPTPEELSFIQLTLDDKGLDFKKTKSIFKKWVLLNGFEDIHKAIKGLLERLIVFKDIEFELKNNKNLQVEEFERNRLAQARVWKTPQLFDELKRRYGIKLECENHFTSFNAARNCLIHTDGIVTERHCSNGTKDKLIIYGQRFKLFFSKGDEEIEAELGRAVPENTGLMLGAEEFHIEFSLDEPVDLSLKQFVEILHTCVFMRAEIDALLK